jgi:hypothetical protein
MSRNPKNTQDNLNNTTNLNNIRDEERTIPEIDRKQELADLDRLLELSKNPCSNSIFEDTEKEKFKFKKQKQKKTRLWR